VASQYRRGQRVRQLAAPHREGAVIAVRASGKYATIIVSFTGWQVISCGPSALEII
jgi:hypothetical protein